MSKSKMVPWYKTQKKSGDPVKKTPPIGRNPRGNEDRKRRNMLGPWDLERTPSVYIGERDKKKVKDPQKKGLLSSLINPGNRSL